jgi:hypothetical protein
LSFFDLQWSQALVVFLDLLRLTRSVGSVLRSPGDPSDAWLRFRDCLDALAADVTLAGETPDSVGVRLDARCRPDMAGELDLGNGRSLDREMESPVHALYWVYFGRADMEDNN